MNDIIDDDPLVFALGATRDFGERVCAHLGLPLSAHEERDFEDGEHKTRPLVNVRNRDVYVLHSLYGEAGQSGNDKLCRLLFFLGALKDAGAARATAVTPYLAYARKDRKSKARDPVTTRYLAALFEAVGTDAILTMDVHNLSAYQNAFRCRSEHLEANSLFIAHFLSGLQTAEVVVVAPDAGGIKRAEEFRQRLSRDLARPVGMAFAEKHRSGGVLTGELLVGDVNGKHAIILDDLISTGSTIARTAKACRSHGATRVMAAATHGLFMPGAEHVLSERALDEIVVADTVPPFRLPAGAVRGKLMVLDSTRLFGEAIRRLHTGESIVDLLESG